LFKSGAIKKALEYENENKFNFKKEKIEK